MTPEDFKNLKPGDIIRNKSGSEGYIITAHYGSRATAVRTIDVTNPSEWDWIVVKSTGEWRME